MVPTAESLDWWHQHHLVTCKNWKFLDASPHLIESRTFRVRSRDWCFNKAPSGSDPQGSMRNTDVVNSHFHSASHTHLSPQFSLLTLTSWSSKGSHYQIYQPTYPICGHTFRLSQHWHTRSRSLLPASVPSRSCVVIRSSSWMIIPISIQICHYRFYLRK